MSTPRSRGPERRRLFDDPRNVRRVIGLLFACCAVLLALDLFVHRHATFPAGRFEVETWFGFWAFYGFVACVLLVLVAKQMRRVIGRPEAYYGPPQPEDAPAGLEVVPVQREERTEGSGRGDA